MNKERMTTVCRVRWTSATTSRFAKVNSRSLLSDGVHRDDALDGKKSLTDLDRNRFDDGQHHHR